MSQKITTFLWFDTQAEEAARYYTSLFPDSRIVEVSHYGEAGPLPAGTVMTVVFELAGQRFMALNGGPEYHFTPAISLLVDCPTQEEVDTIWQRILDDGGSEVACGWITDRYGLSWQIVPAGFIGLVTDPDPERAQRAMRAMMQMKKLDIHALEAAAAG